MPELVFTVRWPDGRAAACYSPSLVVQEHLHPGQQLDVAAFVAVTGQALQTASERVRARFGMPCQRALTQHAQIVEQARGFAPDQVVTVLAMDPGPSPAGTTPTAGTP